jgi:MinD superfamily P-loop ATPase
MQIAIASGKGGTGKTTLSVALALAAGKPVALLDCDVEEPNDALFLKPEITSRKPVSVLVPKVDSTLCNGCGECSSFCEFNALAVGGKTALVFPDLCHSCGGCMRVCPQNAITATDQTVGELSFGHFQNVQFIEGCLDIGRAMAPPVIRTVKKSAPKTELTLIDCPPGTSCAMITAVSGCDFAALVTEPTPFGLHDLKLSVETVRKLSIPFGVVINRADSGDRRVADYCRNEQIPLLLEIPESRAIAKACSQGKTLLDAAPELKPALLSILENAQWSPTENPVAPYDMTRLRQRLRRGSSAHREEQHHAAADEEAFAALLLSLRTSLTSCLPA